LSAIVGVFYADGKAVDRETLGGMMEAVAHRGPDGTGLWCEGPIGLGQRTLWTTPESLHERLPLSNQRGDLVITADARIDNREELFSRLGMADGCQERVGDSELILAAYEKWGEGCPERLLGAFAFAVWDRREQKLFCARDHFGVKPLYYYWGNQALVLGSEIKALFCLPEVPRQLNEVRIADYLVPMFEDKAITFFRDVYRLRPGHSMVVSQDGARWQTYWSLDPGREVRLASNAAYSEAFGEIFAEAVRCRLRSAYPLGSMLSGGMDSSAVACTARVLLEENGKGPVHTFSAIFDEVPECDERPFIHAVLAQDGFTPHFMHADRLSPLHDLDRALWHEDEAFYAPNLFVAWGLYDLVNRERVRVVLDGLDGDTTLSHGIAYLTELAHTGRLVALLREVRGLSRHLDVPPKKALRNRVIRPLVPEGVRRAWRRLRGRSSLVWLANPTIRPEFARHIGLTQRFEALVEERMKPARTEREDHYRRLTSGHLPFVLEVADRAAAAFSVEGRYPFFDKRLVEFCLALPPEQKISRGWTRMILRRAMEEVLPKEVQWRDGKSDLSANFNRGLLTADRELVEDVIMKDPQAIEPYVDVAALRQAYARCLSRPTNRDTMMVWKAVSLALWLSRTGYGHPVRKGGASKEQEPMAD
jgi:asparagine synthase (glutamine-hydrolysing)